MPKMSRPRRGATASETVDGMFGWLNEVERVEDGCLAVESSPSWELPSDRTNMSNAMPMMSSGEATPESVSMCGEPEQVRAVRSGR